MFITEKPKNTNEKNFCISLYPQVPASPSPDQKQSVLILANGDKSLMA